MATPKYIDKKQQLQIGLDYQFLKKKGLEHIQELAGDNWTDFNAHDPGVTMLEQLAYALTELGYRSNMDFVDLLASQQKKNLKDTLFTASKILPTNPLTEKDYRKIIIDRVTGVRNVWIYPLNSFTNRKNIKGLYLAFLEVDQYTNRNHEDIRLEVKKTLNFFSNLGETFEDVILFKKQEIYLKCEIELDKDAIAEHVHAHVLFELERLITKPLVYNSLNEMLDRGFEVNEIFDGPRLYNGFIEDQSLTEKDSIFYNSQLLNTIRSVKGIKAIRNFNLVIESEDEYGNVIYKDYVDELSQQEVDEVVVIRWDSIAVLGSKIYKNANNHNYFTYVKNGVHLHLFQKEVDRNLKALEASVKLGYNQKFEQENDFPVPKGKHYPIDKYHSIQHQFPLIYGLSKEGISSDLSDERRAKIYQLKGYLLFFEQVMSNYLEQLSRFNELYSLDESLSSSYFVQVPWDIPGIYKLIGSLKPDQDEKEFRQLFQASVEKIMSEIDNFHERRTAFIHHLLARFGDHTFNYSFQKFNYYHSKETHRKNILNQYLDILKNYQWLSGNKARSFDHSRELWQKKTRTGKTSETHPNLSVLESRMRMTIGLPLTVEKIGKNVAPHVRFAQDPLLLDWSELSEKVDEKNLTPLKNDLKGIWIKEDAFKNFLDETLVEPISIDEDVFKRGFWDENLKIVKSPLSQKGKYLLLFRKKMDHGHNTKTAENLQEFLRSASTRLKRASLDILYVKNKKALYCFEFKRNIHGEFMQIPGTVWQVLATYDSNDLAFRAAYSLKNKLLQLNLKSEGFYLLDHILLRPRDKNVQVNILLNDPSSDWSFRLKKAYDLADIENGIRDDINAIRNLPYQLEPKKEMYLIVWKKDKELIGRCTRKYHSKIDAIEKAEEIQAYFRKFSDFDIYDSNRVKFKREIEESVHPLHHYSFTITVFLSAWTARFSDTEFRYLFESVFRKNTPAHIAVQFKWISLDKMVEFEKLYEKWLRENRREKINFNKLNLLSNDLLTFAKNN